MIKALILVVCGFLCVSSIGSADSEVVSIEDKKANKKI